VAAGIVVGPYTPGPTVVRREDIDLLADIGVALLLFAIGLDLPLHLLAPVRRVAVWGTTLQIVLITALGGLAGRLLGLNGAAALWLGALTALSSTAVVLKTLQERGLSTTLAGRVMVGMLLVQDLAVIPLMVLLPSLEHLDQGLRALGVAGLRAGMLVAATVWLGTRVLPRVLEQVARWGSRELFLIATVASGLGIGYGAHLVGLPFAFGAFLAGMALSESEYSRQALHDIAPLRDVFVMLFFASVGMLLDPAALWRAGGLVMALLALLAAKGVLVALLVRAFGYGENIPLAAGLSLFQVGEFSFLLARAGAEVGQVAPDTYAAMLTVAAITMSLTPLAINLAERLQARPKRAQGETASPPTSRPQHRSHVVIAGYGRVGRFICEVLQQLDHPFVVIDLDPMAVAAARQAGYETVYGDAAAPAVLEAAGAGEARLVILTIPDPVAVPVAVERVRKLKPDVHVVVRATGLHQLEELSRLGVYEAVLPELEAALELVRQVLAHLDIEPGDIQRFVDRLRRDHYAPLLRPAGDKTISELLRYTSRLLEVEWYQIPQGSPLADRSIGETKVREQTGAFVVAVVRGEEVIPNPGPDVVLHPGDTLGLIGTLSQRKAFRALARGDKNA